MSAPQMIPQSDVAVIGGGVVGAAVAFHLTHSGVQVSVYEKNSAVAMAASGTNSGCLHTGFDSTPGELETELILRSAQLRSEVLERLGIPVLHSGAELVPRREDDRRTVRALAANAAHNGVAVDLCGADGALVVPGEWITDPVAYTEALFRSAQQHGASLITGAAVTAIRPREEGFHLHFADGRRTSARYVINAAGLFADEVARMVGDRSFSIYPRKGEFLVFDRPDDAYFDRIHLPVPTARTKGVLIFPTIDGKVIAGPTAQDITDKDDWSVRAEAHAEIVEKVRMYAPSLAQSTPIARYSGLRTAGVDDNYIIGPSALHPGFINVAAIRSTGLSASLGIGEYVAKILDQQGLALDNFQLPAPSPEASHAADRAPWWARTARHLDRQALAPTE